MFNLRSLDLNLLTIFEVIYELGTVSGAADRFALSQSANHRCASSLSMACMCRTDAGRTSRTGLIAGT
jgi:hypothetical protein